MAPALRISNELGVLKAQPRAHQWQHSPWVWILGFSAPDPVQVEQRRVLCSAQLREPVPPSSPCTWAQQAGGPRGTPSSQPSSRAHRPLPACLCCRAARTHPGVAGNPSWQRAGEGRSAHGTQGMDPRAASWHSRSLEGSWVKMDPLLLWCPGIPQLQAARIWVAVPKQGHAMCRVWLLRESLELPLERQQEPAPWL